MTQDRPAQHGDARVEQPWRLIQHRGRDDARCATEWSGSVGTAPERGRLNGVAGDVGTADPGRARGGVRVLRSCAQSDAESRCPLSGGALDETIAVC